MLRFIGVLGALLLLLAQPPFAFAQQDAPAYLPNTVSNDLSGKTVRFASQRHGEGVLYFAQDGRAFMWTPGRLEVLSGTWSGDTIRWLKGSQKTPMVQEVIALSFPGSFKNTGGVFAFLEASRIQDDLGVKEAAEGDTLALADGQPPCRTCRADMTFAQMLGK